MDSSGKDMQGFMSPAVLANLVHKHLQCCQYSTLPLSGLGHHASPPSSSTKGVAFVFLQSQVGFWHAVVQWAVAETAVESHLVSHPSLQCAFLYEVLLL